MSPTIVQHVSDPTVAPPHEAAITPGPIVAPKEVYARHRWPVRAMHWINAICFFLLLMSGLQIFNAHPALNWGKSSYNGNPPVLEIGSRVDAQGQRKGVTAILGHEFTTTGALGYFEDANGNGSERAFPQWATLPGSQWLSMARSWHFLLAWILVLNGIAYIVYGLWTRHVRRDLVPDARELKTIGASLKQHLLFRHPTGESAKRYNVLQKLTYLLVIFVLFPAIITMGWAMSPWLNSLAPGWVDLFGGRQSARTLHFVVAFALLAFVFVHLFEVVVTGLWNNVRSMITGKYVVPKEKDHG